MNLTFIFDKSCKIEVSGNTIKVIAETKELNIPVIIEGCKIETNRYLQVRDKDWEIKAGIK